jgi:hypothetical protein
MASALLIANRATDTATGPAAQTTDARLALERITADLNDATALAEQTNSTVAFTVADRDSDDNEDTIRYAWSAVPGEPLTRQQNSSPATPVIENVRQFELRYLARALVTIPPEETPETVLASHGLASPMGSQKDFSVDQSHWCAQWLIPSMPVNALSWKLTRVQVPLKRENAARSLQIECRTADVRQTPTAQILEACAVSSDSLPDAYAWREVSFSSVSGLDPAQGICLVITQASDTTGARVWYHESGSAMPQKTHWTQTTNTGDSWDQPVSNRDMYFYAYGTITTQGPPEW